MEGRPEVTFQQVRLILMDQIFVVIAAGLCYRGSEIVIAMKQIANFSDDRTSKSPLKNQAQGTRLFKRCIHMSNHSVT